MLQNRVTPDACIVAEPWRGEMMGNRGGRIHDPSTKTLLTRRWASKRWISCVTQFKQRQRTVMGESYTELFFLDEVSALASGHRPCFECRRKAADDFAWCWSSVNGLKIRAKADDMDYILHEERTGVKAGQAWYDPTVLPVGAMIQDETGACFARSHDAILLWSGTGYVRGQKPQGQCRLLTPRSIVQVLERGYQPVWHSSAQVI